MVIELELQQPDTILQRLKRFFSHSSQKNREKQISLEDVQALPTQSQLLLAHALQRNDDTITLRKGDDCNCFPSGWLLLRPTTTTTGMIDYRISPRAWRQLWCLRADFLTSQLLVQLKTFRRRKSSEYPWNW
jgi:hypothetical protein